METGNCEKVQRAGLLEWFFDVLRRLVPQTKHNSAEKILDLWRVLQPSTQRILHPGPRLLRCPHDRVAPTVSNQRAVLRIANEESSTNIAAREISTHIEFAGISRRRDRLGSSKKFQFIAKFGHALPTNLPNSARGMFPTFELN